MTIGERFRIERRLGRGGMASVYLAHDEALGRRVAVKVLEAEGDGENRRRFLREAKLAARLAHPNVVAVFDAGEHDGTPYIVMEYVEGESLAELVARRGRLPPEEVARLAREACAGLQHAHDSGLVHRDVKPHNLLVRKDGTLKISDFGIARAADVTRITTAGTIVGTAAYLAPEVTAGEEASRAADIYGLGASLYEALTGRPPLEVKSLAELREAQARPPAPVRELAPEAPPELEAAIMQALARRPEQRPASAAQLARALGEPLPEALTVPLARRPRRRPSRRIAAVGAAAVALLAAVLTPALLLTARGGGEPAPSPIPQRADPAEQARAISAWLRENAG